MGEANGFERGRIGQARTGVGSGFAEYGLRAASGGAWPGWRTVFDADQKAWLRADAGGVVGMHYERGDLVEAGAPICTITNPFKTDRNAVTAPFTGLLVGVLENPVVYPGNPLCHIVELDEETRAAYLKSRGETPLERSATPPDGDPTPAE
jgi:predicted deacylase